jgi:hypothetical protein
LSLALDYCAFRAINTWRSCSVWWSVKNWTHRLHLCNLTALMLVHAWIKRNSIKYPLLDSVCEWTKGGQ